MLHSYFIVSMRRSPTNSDTDIKLFRARSKNEVYIYCIVNKKPIVYMDETTEGVFNDADTSARIELMINTR